MTEHHEKSHAHRSHERRTAEPTASVASSARNVETKAPEASRAPTVPDELTIYTEDGKWKATLKAYKNWLGIYQSIGAEVDVYERRQTRDTWGHTTTDWVATPTTIYMVADFHGDVANPQVPQNPLQNPPGGGFGSYSQATERRDSHCELKLWAFGLFSTTITVSGESTTPTGATLNIASVVSEIEIATPSGRIRGTVGASSFASDNSAWG